MATGRALIHVADRTLTLNIQDDKVIFNVFYAMKHPMEKEDCFQIDVLHSIITRTFRETFPSSPLEKVLVHAKSIVDHDEGPLVVEHVALLDVVPSYSASSPPKVEELHKEETEVQT